MVIGNFSAALITWVYNSVLVSFYGVFIIAGDRPFAAFPYIVCSSPHSHGADGSSNYPYFLRLALHRPASVRNWFMFFHVAHLLLYSGAEFFRWHYPRCFVSNYFPSPIHSLVIGIFRNDFVLFRKLFLDLSRYVHECDPCIICREFFIILVHSQCATCTNRRISGGSIPDTAAYTLFTVVFFRHQLNSMIIIYLRFRFNLTNNNISFCFIAFYKIQYYTSINLKLLKFKRFKMF